MSRMERKEFSPNYMTDETLEKMIASVEAEPLLHPPREFKQDLINQIRLKRKRSKDKQLFLYSMKVIAATAAIIWMMIVLPENILPENVFLEKNGQSVQMQEPTDGNNVKESPSPQGAEADYRDSFNNRLNNRLNTYCSQLNEGLNKLVRMEVFE